MKKINTFDLWAENWENAKRFFESKGNAETKSKLKDRWYKDFMDMFKMIESKLNPKTPSEWIEMEEPYPKTPFGYYLRKYALKVIDDLSDKKIKPPKEV